MDLVKAIAILTIAVVAIVLVSPAVDLDDCNPAPSNNLHALPVNLVQAVMVIGAFALNAPDSTHPAALPISFATTSLRI